MKTKLITLQDAAGFFRDGMTIMVGGFMGGWHTTSSG